jgi:hypothetical protein
MQSRPDKPDLNASIERFDGSDLKEAFDAYPVGSRDDVPVETDSA